MKAPRDKRVPVQVHTTLPSADWRLHGVAEVRLALLVGLDGLPVELITTTAITRPNIYEAHQ